MRPGVALMMGSRCVTPGLPAVNPIIQVVTSPTNRTDALTLVVTGFATPVSGNLLIICANSGSVLDTPAGWAKDVTIVNQLECSMYSKISNGAESSITINLTGSGTAQWTFLEIHGYTTFDKKSTSTGGNPNAFCDCAATPATTQANEIAIAFTALQDSPDGDLGPAVSWSNSFTQRAFTGVKSAIGGPPWTLQQGCATKILSAIDTPSTRFTFTSTTTVGEFYGIIGTYK